MFFKTKAKTYEKQMKNLVKHALRSARLGNFEDITDIDSDSDYGDRVFWRRKVDGKQYWVIYWVISTPSMLGFDYNVYTDYCCEKCGAERSLELPSNETLCRGCREDEKKD